MKYHLFRLFGFERITGLFLLFSVCLLINACSPTDDTHIKTLYDASVKEKNGLPLSPDSSALKKANKYFTDRNALREEMRTLFYLGEIREEQRDYPEALSVFKDAAQLAEELHDDYWLSYIYSKIGFLYRYEYNIPTSDDYLLLSLKHGAEIEVSSDDIGYYLQLGRTFLFAGEPKLALSYFEKIKPHVTRADSRYTRLYRSIGLGMFHSGYENQAVEAFHESLRDEGHPEHIMICKTTLLHIAVHKKDEINMSRYVKEIEQILPSVNNLDLHKEFHRICSVIQADRGNFKEAYEEMNLSFVYGEDKLNYLGKLSVDELLLKNYQKKMTEVNRELEADNRWLFIVFCVSWLAIALLGYWLKKKRAKKLYDLERKIELLEEMAGQNNNESEDLKNLIIRDLEIIKRIALFKSQHSRDTSFVEQFNRVVTVDKFNPFELEWQKLYSDVDRLYGGFYSKLVKLDISLTEKELQLCCLMKIGFRTDEVAAIWDQSVYSVQKYRSNIRRKLATSEGADIIQFLDEKFA